MKNLIPFLFLIPSASFGQVYVNGENINTKSGVKICELLLLEDVIVSSDIMATIDYGQTRKDFDGKITDQNGARIKFGSAVGAINHMENNGWEYLNNSIIPKGRGLVYRYYFRKKEAKQEITVRAASALSN